MVLVVPKENLHLAKEEINRLLIPELQAKVVVVSGSKSRHGSIKEGIQELQKYNLPFVLIHDAVRPAPEEPVCRNIMNEAAKYGVDIIYTAIRKLIKFIYLTVHFLGLWSICSPGFDDNSAG